MIEDGENAQRRIVSTVEFIGGIMKTKLPRIIDGTSGPDTLFGDFRNGTLHGKGASQTLNGLGGDDTLYGDSFSMDGTARGGDDSLNGGDGNDILYGDAYAMHGVRGAKARLS